MPVRHVASPAFVAAVGFALLCFFLPMMGAHGPWMGMLPALPKVSSKLSTSIPLPWLAVSPADRGARFRNVVDKPMCCMAETCLPLRDHGSQQQEPEVGKREGAETRELAHAITGETARPCGRGAEVLRLPGCGSRALPSSSCLEQLTCGMSPDVPVPNEPATGGMASSAGTASQVRVIAARLRCSSRRENHQYQGRHVRGHRRPPRRLAM